MRENYDVNGAPGAERPQADSRPISTASCIQSSQPNARTGSPNCGWCRIAPGGRVQADRGFSPQTINRKDLQRREVQLDANASTAGSAGEVSNDIVKALDGMEMTKPPGYRYVDGRLRPRT